MELFSDVLGNQIDILIRFSNGFSFVCPRTHTHTRITYRHSIYSNGGNCKAISHLRLVSLVVGSEISQIKLQIGLILWNFVSDGFHYCTTIVARTVLWKRRREKKTPYNTPTRMYQNWYDEQREQKWYGRPLAIALMLSPSAQYMVLWLSFSIEAGPKKKSQSHTHSETTDLQISNENSLQIRLDSHFPWHPPPTIRCQNFQ